MVGNAAKSTVATYSTQTNAVATVSAIQQHFPQTFWQPTSQLNEIAIQNGEISVSHTKTFLEEY